MFSLFPLLTMLLAAALGRERLRWPVTVGVGLSILGVALDLAPRLVSVGRTGATQAPANSR